MKKFFLLLIIVLFVAVVNTKAQSIYIYFTDGTNLSSPLSEVQKIYFNGSDMQMLKTDGVTLSWPIQDIQKYTYDETITNVSETKAENLDVLIYPNPSNGRFSINYTVENQSKIDISIIGINGNIFETILSKKIDKGQHSISWENTSLKAGTYFVKLQNNNQITIKKLIILK